MKFPKLAGDDKNRIVMIIMAFMFLILMSGMQSCHLKSKCIKYQNCTQVGIK